MMRHFVHDRKDLTEAELLEYNAICQLLPGASSTQLITAIGYKRGGITLAILTFLIWILPACFLMGLISFIVSSEAIKSNIENAFKYIQPMAIAFLCNAAILSYQFSINNTITRLIMIFGAILMLFFFKTPWILPILIITAGILTNFSKKRFPKIKNTTKKIKWLNIIVFFLVFIIAGFLSENARKNNWKERKSFNLFENCYRFGSIVFGGGDVLLPMMLDQYVLRPSDKKLINKNPGLIKIDKNELLGGYAMVKAIPGPVFSYASYVGGMALKNEGLKKQVLGCILGSISIFLPSLLLILFFFPVWHNLKKYTIIHRALEGINAVVVGVILAAALFLLHEMFNQNNGISITRSFLVLMITFILIRYTKTPIPIIILLTILSGFIF